MKIFCDESGGFDGDKHSLVLSAVRISEHDATRLMKQFRKAIRATNEVKGGLLTDPDRALFFDMLSKEEHFAAAVTCHRKSQLGATVAALQREHEVFEDMLFEACNPLTNVGNSIRVSADGGRYSRPILSRLSARIGARLSRDDFATVVDFVRSDLTPGVQIADIIANTVYKATCSGSFDSTAACGILVEQKRLLVTTAELPTVKPGWMQIAAE